MTGTRATIVVTRPEDENGPLARLFREAGQNVLHWQVTSIAPPLDINPLRCALKELDDYDWVVFSSAAAVDAVIGLRSAPPTYARVAAVGTATATALRQAGWPVDLIPVQAGAEHLATALLAQAHKVRRILFPASAIALPALARLLRQAGVAVEQIEAYRVVNIAGAADAWRIDLAKGAVDAVTFASPSAVSGLRAALNDTAFGKLNGLVVVAIGATTATALRQNGLTVTTVASRSTLEDLAAATLAALAARTSAPKGLTP